MILIIPNQLVRYNILKYLKDIRLSVFELEIDLQMEEFYSSPEG